MFLSPYIVKESEDLTTNEGVRAWRDQGPLFVLTCSLKQTDTLLPSRHHLLCFSVCILPSYCFGVDERSSQSLYPHQHHECHFRFKVQVWLLIPGKSPERLKEKYAWRGLFPLARRKKLSISCYPFNTGKHFHIHSAYYFSILYCFRNSCGA